MAIALARKSLIHPTAIIYPNVELGPGATVEPYVILGSINCKPLYIGANATLRSYTRIEAGPSIGDDLQTGNHALVRGDVKIGDRCKIGSYSSIEGDVWLGDDVTIRGRCEIPNSKIGNRVQIYAGTFFYDTPNPPDGPNLPPIIEEDCILCCDVRVLGGVRIGRDSFVTAQAFVTRDVPPGSYVKRDGSAVPRR